MSLPNLDPGNAFDDLQSLGSLPIEQQNAHSLKEPKARIDVDALAKSEAEREQVAAEAQRRPIPTHVPADDPVSSKIVWAVILVAAVFLAVK